MAENNAALALLMTDLGYINGNVVPDAVKALIEHKLEAADARLEAAGIDPKSDSQSVLDLRVMYAAYLYRHKDSDREMPRSLRLALNDAKVAAAKAGAAG